MPVPHGSCEAPSAGDAVDESVGIGAYGTAIVGAAPDSGGGEATVVTVNQPEEKRRAAAKPNPVTVADVFAPDQATFSTHPPKGPRRLGAGILVPTRCPRPWNRRPTTTIGSANRPVWCGPHSSTSPATAQASPRSPRSPVPNSGPKPEPTTRSDPSGVPRETPGVTTTGGTAPSTDDGRPVGDEHRRARPGRSGER